MKRGRPPQPTQMHKLRGSYRADRHGSNEPKVEPSLPDPPGWLSESGQRCFTDLGRKLYGLGVMGSPHALSLALLADAFGRYCELRDQVHEAGYTVTTSNGNVVQHPLVGAMNKAWEQTMKGLREFGLTPAALRGVSMIGGGDQGEGESDAKRRALRLVRGD